MRPSAYLTVACTDDLIRGWGADPGALVEVSGRESATMFKADNYPLDAVRKHQEGRVVSMTIVDRAGRLTGCKPVVPSSVAVLDATTCALVMRNRFAPAPDGPPPRYLFLAVT